MNQSRTFSITPQGAFSLLEANAFGFGQRDAHHGHRMALAFAVDGGYEPAGVELTQSEDGVVHGTVFGSIAPMDAVVAQVSRILSLDHDGRAWDDLLDGEAPLRRLADGVPGLRPVLFHSPYEAAAWSIISSRIHSAQAAKIRDDLAATFGRSYDLHDQTLHAFPSPERLIEGLASWGGLNEVKRERLLGVARAADDGLLDAAWLRSLGPDGTHARMLGLTGIGPFYASLITIRATGFADTYVEEPRARAAALAAYDLAPGASDADWRELSDRWRPFRVWATVLCRVASARGLALAA